MIRLVHLLKRRPDCDPGSFAAWLRDVQGPLVAAHQHRLGLVRMLFTVPAPGTADIDAEASRVRGGVEPAFDAVAEYWWWSEADLADALATPAGAAAHADLIASEGEHVDLAASPLWFAHEYPQVGTMPQRPVARFRTGLVKVHFALRPLPGLTLAEAQRYWLTMHGPLVRSHAGARGAVGYNQVHAFDCPLLPAMRDPRGSTAEPYMGHAEAWFDRIVQRSGPDAQEATAAAVADERNFIDWPRSTFLSGKEIVFVDRDWT